MDSNITTEGADWVGHDTVGEKRSLGATVRLGISLGGRKVAYGQSRKVAYGQMGILCASVGLGNGSSGQ